MGGLLADLIPLALGVILSPLAIVALIAVLVSPRARVNGISYFLGWTAGMTALVLLFCWIFTTVQIQPHDPPAWVALVHLVLGLVLLVFGIVIYRRGHHQLHQMKRAEKFGEVVQAAPQLPGYLRSVASFRAGRTFALGAGLFVLNPVDASCTILAMLSIATSTVPAGAAQLITVLFVLVGVLPIGIPVVYVVWKGEAARPGLERIRTWIAGNTHVVNAGLLLVVGAMQIQSGLSALL